MKLFYKTLLAALVLFTGNLCFSQTISEPYEVATWQGFRTSAITYTFDDGCSNQLALAVPMFDEFGYKLTLYTVTSWNPDWAGLKKAASNGHEIGCHSVTHPYFNNLTDAQLTDETKNSQNAINAQIPGNQCVTIAYPYCITGNLTIVKQFFFAGRGCQGYIEGKTPSNFLNISSIIVGSQGSIKTSKDFNSKAESAAKSKGWCVYLIHGIDNDGGYSPIPSDTLRKSLEYLKANENKFWVASFANVAGYIKERNCVSVSESSSKENSITVQVTDTLDNSIFKYPITIRRPLPDGWTSSGVTQNGKDLPAQIVEVDSTKYIMFDVVPDNGDILLIKDGTTAVRNINEQVIPQPVLYENYPNPFNPSTTIKFSIPKQTNVSLRIFNTMGQEVALLLSEEMNAGVYTINWNANGFASGVYYYQITAGNYIQTRKLVLLK